MNGSLNRLAHAPSPVHTIVELVRVLLDEDDILRYRFTNDDDNRLGGGTPAPSWTTAGTPAWTPSWAPAAAPAWCAAATVTVAAALLPLLLALLMFLALVFVLLPLQSTSTK